MSDCVNYLLFARTTEEETMNVGNIFIIYSGETGNGLLRTLAMIFRLHRAGDKAEESKFENRLDRIIFKHFLAQNRLYMMAVRKSFNHAEVKTSEFASKF